MNDAETFVSMQPELHVRWRICVWVCVCVEEMRTRTHGPRGHILAKNGHIASLQQRAETLHFITADQILDMRKIMNPAQSRSNSWRTRETKTSSPRNRGGVCVEINQI